MLLGLVGNVGVQVLDETLRIVQISLLCGARIIHHGNAEQDSPSDLAYRSPNTNAYVERFIQSIQQECLDRFVVFGTQHLDHLGAEYLAHYHEERPHQSLNNEPLVKPKKRGRPATKRGKIDDEIVRIADVRCSKRLGGLLKSYSRRAA